MTLLVTLEDAIVARLAAALTLPGQPHPKVEVRAWPEKAADYRLTHPHGAVMVVYKGTRYSTARASAGQLVDALMDFELGILSRTLREPNAPEKGAAAGVSAYGLLDTCRTALMGWKPDLASDVVQVIRDGFDAGGEGVWGYRMELAVPMTLVVDRDCVPGPWAVDGPNACCADAPPLSQVTLSPI